MDKKHLESLAEGYTFDASGIIRNPGKFEGETLATLYFYDAYLNGVGPTFEVTKEEKEEFNIDAPFVYLAESNDGFVSLISCESLAEAEDMESNDLAEDLLDGEDF